MTSPRVRTASARAGSGHQVMAALRNTAINLARLAGHTNIVAAQRRYSRQLTAALDNHQRSMRPA